MSPDVFDSYELHHRRALADAAVVIECPGLLALRPRTLPPLNPGGSLKSR